MDGHRHVYLNPASPLQIAFETGPEVTAGKFFFYDDDSEGYYTSGRNERIEEGWLEYTPPTLPAEGETPTVTPVPNDGTTRRIYIDPAEPTTIALETGPGVYYKYLVFNERSGGSPSDGTREGIAETWLQYTPPVIPDDQPEDPEV